MKSRAVSNTPHINRLIHPYKAKRNTVVRRKHVGPLKVNIYTAAREEQGGEHLHHSQSAMRRKLKISLGPGNIQGIDLRTP